MEFLWLALMMIPLGIFLLIFLADRGYPPTTKTPQISVTHEIRSSRKTRLAIEHAAMDLWEKQLNPPVEEKPRYAPPTMGGAMYTAMLPERNPTVYEAEIEELSPYDLSPRHLSMHNYCADVGSADYRCAAVKQGKAWQEEPPPEFSSERAMYDYWNARVNETTERMNRWGNDIQWHRYRQYAEERREKHWESLRKADPMALRVPPQRSQYTGIPMPYQQNTYARWSEPLPGAYYERHKRYEMEKAFTLLAKSPHHRRNGSGNTH